MQLKDSIINIALIGTDKKMPAAAELPAYLSADFAALENAGGDAESRFMKTAALALNFYRAGVQPTRLDALASEAPVEQRQYVSDACMALLQNVLADKYFVLVKFWCSLCADKNRIAQPHILPELFEWCVATKKVDKNLLIALSGERGKWLSKFKPDWNFFDAEPELTDWKTATGKQRTGYLMQQRKTAPLTVVELVTSVWNEENAAGRTELLSVFETNLSLQDEAFLITALNDKSKTVKDKALALLKQIPGSSIINTYTTILQQSIKLKESKVLGFISRTSIEINLQMHDEEVFKTGIDKLSNDKKITDADFVLMQLIASVPPSCWRKQFSAGTVEVVKLFAQRDELQKFQQALCISTLKFMDSDFAVAILEQFANPPAVLLRVLPVELRLKLALKVLKQNPDETLSTLCSLPVVEWNMPLAEAVLQETAQNWHKYGKAFYENICIYLPADIIVKLNTISFQEEWKKNTWAALAAEIEKLVRLKESIKLNPF
jgi:hypothetical protein